MVMYNYKNIFQTENPPKSTALLLYPFSEVDKLITSTLQNKKPEATKLSTYSSLRLRNNRLVSSRVSVTS